MRAVVAEAFGDRSAIKVVQLPCPTPKPNEVLVRLVYAGVNFSDIQMRDGSYARPRGREVSLPITLGIEGAGTVTQLGSNVTGVSVGERVTFCLAAGTYAEYTTVSAWRLIRVPDAMPLNVATALTLQGLTAQYLSRTTYPLDVDTTCLVHSAAGGVGQLLVQLARAAGATVLASVGDSSKVTVAVDLGADEVFVLDGSNFSQFVRAHTSGRGVDVVYDAIGIATINESMRSLRPRGLCVLYGGSSGLVDVISTQRLAEAGSLFFTRPHLTHYLANAREIGARSSELFAAWQAGKLAVRIGGTFELNDVAKAHDLLESRKSQGKLLIKVMDDRS